ncbi:BMC domain-containing protein [Enterobacteriaceae bacterium LUAb1]
MKSLGVIETHGLLTAIQAVDAACKAASVTCTGFRKVGAGLVSVCFEGEISAIHAAIEHGVAVAGAGQHVSSLIIARPERSVVDALSTLKGFSPCTTVNSVPSKTPVTAPLPADKTDPLVSSSPQPTPGKPENKDTLKKEKKV